MAGALKMVQQVNASSIIMQKLNKVSNFKKMHQFAHPHAQEDGGGGG